MSRRNKTPSALEFFLDEVVKLSAMLPLWVTIPAAIVLFIFVPSVDINTLDSDTQASMATTVANIFLLVTAKYVIPAGLIIGVVVNIINRFKSHSLFSAISVNGAYTTLEKISWQDFEFLLSEWFKKQGYSAELTGGGGADGGIDIKLYKDGGLHLVQCKHYKSSKVPVMVVRELYGVMTAEKAIGGFVVTSGRFTQEAYSFARKTNIELIDKKKLVAILDNVDVSALQSTSTQEVKCPRCGNVLVQRRGKYGPFIGCSTYPNCDYTEKLA